MPIDQNTRIRLIRAYIDGWKERDREKVLGTLNPDSVVIECNGPVYRGSGRVGEWIDAWFAEGNTIDQWDITSLFVADDAVAVEWRFACTWHGAPSAFDGASIVRCKDSRIAYLREYATTKQLYDWVGTWRP
jgi:hypothetical protein